MLSVGSAWGFDTDFPSPNPKEKERFINLVSIVPRLFIKFLPPAENNTDFISSR